MKRRARFAIARNRTAGYGSCVNDCEPVFHGTRGQSVVAFVVGSKLTGLGKQSNGGTVCGRDRRNARPFPTPQRAEARVRLCGS